MKFAGVSYYSFHGAVALGDKSNPDLVGTKWYPIADQMLDDPVIAGLTWLLSSTISGAQWSIEGGTDEHRAFIESVFDKKFNSIIESAIRYLWYGSYAFEQKLWVRNDGKIVDMLLPRQPHTFIRYIRDANTRKLTQIQQTSQNGVGYLQIPRTVLLIRQSEGWQNLNGRSVLRPCYQPWLLKVEHRTQDLFGAQRWANGTLDIEMAPGATEDDATKAAQMAAAYAGGANTYIIRRPDANIKSLNILQASGTPYDAEPKVQAYNKEIATAFLGQFLVMDGGSLGGAQELVRESLERFFVAVSALADEIAEQFTVQRIHRLLAWNFQDFNPDDAPYLTFSGINKTDGYQIAEFVQKVATILPADFFGIDDWNTIKESIGLTPYKVQESKELSSGCNCGNCKVELSFTPAAQWQAPRELTPLEQVVAFGAIVETQDREAQRLSDRLAKVTEDMIGVYMRYAAPAVTGRDVAKIEKMEPRYIDELEAVLSDTMVRMYRYGQTSVFDEARRQRVTSLAQADPAQEAIAAQNALAKKKARAISQAVADAVETQALEMIGAGTTLDALTVQDALYQAADRRAKAVIRDAAYAIPAIAFGAGRNAAAQEVGASKVYYSAVMDVNSCEWCARADGKEVRGGMPAAPNPDCLGGSRCRCIHVYEFDQ